MKKSVFIRVLTLTLVLVTAISLLPMTALARNDGLPYIFHSYIVDDVKTPYYDIFQQNPINESQYGSIDEQTVFQPAKQITHNGKSYELKSVSTVPYDIIFPFIYPNYSSKEEIDAANAWLKSTFPEGESSLTIPLYPYSNDNGEQDEWCKLYSEHVYAIYTAVRHQHKLTCWLSDNNNHWANCTVCGEEFVVMDWHHDFNEDDFCDICGHAIIWYDIDVKETDGIKVTVNGGRDMTARYRDLLNVDVEIEDGYELKELQLWKVRVDGSKARLIMHEVTENEAYKFWMKNFACEIVPVMVKK